MDPLFDFTGQVVLVTGGSRGLGYEMVKAFAQRGADVVITSRKKEACDAVAEEVRAMGRKALPYGCNIGNWDEIDGLVEAAYGAFGKVDVLINNAGMSPLTPTSQDVTEALFDKIIDVNFKGPFRLGTLIGHRMAEAGSGNIINISSVGALRAVPNAIPYSGAKAGLNSLTDGFAQEFGRRGVRVNTISAGAFLTDISKAWPEEARKKAANARGTPGEPEEIVTTALYLASAHSGFVTRSVVRVDGGA